VAADSKWIYYDLKIERSGGVGLVAGCPRGAETRTRGLGVAWYPSARPVTTCSVLGLAQLQNFLQNDHVA
jgi:hypothetical protein